ncbi:MAG: hybrid sensor histidine kinase/response regulator transcription factor, partial [Gemmatimonadota bacterium]
QRRAEEELQSKTHDLGERVKELKCLYGISRLREHESMTLDETFQQVANLIPPSWQYPEITAARIVLKGKVFTTENYKETPWQQSSEIITGGERVGRVDVCYLEERPQLAEGPFLSEERHLIDAIAERLGRTVGRKWAEERIRDYQRQLRQMASELSLIEERERRRIATDLHDRIGQTLAVTRIKLSGIRDSAPDVPLDEIMQLLERTIADTRSLTFELSPPVLHELGFEAALEWLAGKFRDEHGIATQFVDDKTPKPLGEDMRVVAFQAVREQLHNAAKHADASLVRVGASTAGSFARIEVSDDGRGFNPEEQLARRGAASGFGLFSIRERLAYLGGQMQIASEPTTGTTVTLVVPLMTVDQAEAVDAEPDTMPFGTRQIRILLVDDQKITREGLQALLDHYPDLHVVGEAASGGEAIQLARELTPNVVVMDVAMPGMSGIEATRRIIDVLPDAKIVALSMHAEGQYVLEMLRAGATGYLLKDCAQEDLAHAIRAVNAKLTFFSPGIADSVIEDYVSKRRTAEEEPRQDITRREREVLKLLAEGHNTKQIAQALNVSVKTVEAHRQHIMDKLELRSLAELTKYAIREGITDLDT